MGCRVLDLYRVSSGSEMAEMYIAVFESGETLVMDDVELPVEAVNDERYADIRFRRVGDRLYYTMRDATERPSRVRDSRDRRRGTDWWPRTRRMWFTCATSMISSTWVSPSVHDVLDWEPSEVVGARRVRPRPPRGLRPR